MSTGSELDGTSPLSLASLGWDEQWAADAERTPSAHTGVLARVARTDVGVARLVTPDGEVTVPAHDVVVGDWVVTDGHTWAHPLPRRTVLARQSSDRTSTEQPLAANVDAVLVVEPMHPGANVRRIERMLTLAWASGAEPMVVLTKTDLVPDHAGQVVADVEAAAPGVEVLAVSGETGAGLAGLRERLGPGRTFVLLGPSGAGKSTLVNALAGREVLATGPVRGDGRGRHTTTHRLLVVVEGLGVLIDTPGIRTVGMTADADGLAAVFADVVALAAECRFADCAHAVEPGCAIQAAVAAGQLEAARVDSYQRLQREIEYQAGRKQARDRADERREGRARSRGAREAMRAKGR